ncbi:MAG: glycoside hydrolase family 3 N-terminal domain-containing protein [archaeon]|jgi:beta-N-acetylhexosaminidase|nr:glycoside hydrolase family 3 N-terminal domain-containing protein [archaeon]
MKQAIAAGAALFVFAILLFPIISLPEEKMEVETSNEQSVYNRLSLRDKAGQMLLIGFEGTEVTPAFAELMRNIRPGGVLLLGRNIVDSEQLVQLTHNLQLLSQEYSSLPLFIAIDQEGGIVSRLLFVDGTPQSQLKDMQHAQRVGSDRGEGLKMHGINMNLAPVLDSREEGDFVYPRFFQREVEVSFQLARGLIQGHREQGVLSVIKHFPGYDGISFNPEEDTIPRIPTAPDISLFHLLSSSEIVMVSHVLYEDIDREHPFPFSDAGISSTRNVFGEDVLVMSDDLLSSAFVNAYSIQDIGKSAVSAGVDILLAAGYPDVHTVEAFSKSMLDASIYDIELERQVENSARRIVELKQSFGRE